MSMKIAFVSTGYYPVHSGGASISAQLIVEQLREAGHEVDVFTTTNRTAGVTQRQSRLFELPDGSGTALPTRFEKNYRLVEHSDGFSEYDIIHAYGFGTLPGLTVGADVPVLGTANNLEWVCINWIGYLRAGCPSYGFREAVSLARDDGYGPVELPLKLAFESIFKQLAQRADRFTTQTPGMKRILGRCGYDAAKIEVIPNLLDPRFEMREEIDGRRIIYVGRLAEKKGVDDIIDAYLSLPAEVREQFEFDIYGSGPLADPIRQYIDSHDGSVSIQYCDYENLPGVYRGASVLVHGSKYPEPFSRTWLEAMASGTPILCSKNPSSTTILDGIASFYDPFNERSLDRKLTDILTDANQRATMIENGKAALEQYRPKTVVQQYVSIYEDITE